MPTRFPFPTVWLRGPLRRPGAFLLAVVMLSLGIGAATAVFSLMAPALLRPLGIPGESRLAEVYRQTEGDGFRMDNGLPLAELDAQQRAHPEIARLALASRERFVVRAEGRGARCLTGSFISSGYFQVMSVWPALGRGFEPGQDTLSEPAVLISHALWVDGFGRDPGALGRILQVNGQPCRVLGVMPKPFRGHDPDQRLDLWLPLGAKARILSTEAESGHVVASSEPTLARLGPGVPLARAEAALRAVGAGYQEAARMPGTRLGPILVRPFRATPTRSLDSRLPAPWLLLASAGSLLLLAIANVVNLQLAQLEARRQEFGIRLALGGQRGRIVRAVLGEHLLLSLAAGVLGLALAMPILRGLQAIRTVSVYEVPFQAGLDRNACLFALALVLITTLGIGLVPALRAARLDLAQTLKDTSSSLTRSGHLQDGMVVVQVALAMALVSGAALVARGLERARSAPLGFRLAGVAGLRLEFPDSWPRSRRADALNSLRERLGTLPGVASASWAEALPMERGSRTFTQFQGGTFRSLAVGPGTFTTLGVMVRRGREFQPGDPGTARIVNQALAERLWPGQDPVGRSLGRGQVLGVVADHGVEADKGVHEPVLFQPMTAEGGQGDTVCLLFQATSAPERLFPAVRRILRETDPDLPLLQLTTLAAHLEGLHHHLWVASWLLGFCGLTALVLAAMGVHSLLLLRVARQSREIGLRMALGARRGRILGQVIARGMRNVLAGMVLGCLGGFWLGRAFHHLFQGVEPLEPGTLLPAALVLLAVSVSACFAPALRAASLDPASAMRRE